MKDFTMASSQPHQQQPSVGIQWVVIQHVLLEKEDYIVNNIVWNDALQESLIEQGLLPVNGSDEQVRVYNITIMCVVTVVMTICNCCFSSP